MTSVPNSGSERQASSACWLTWEHHQRSRSLARALSLDLVELTSSYSRLPRYLVLAIRTALQLLRRKGALIYVQVPSIVLGLVAISIRRPLRLQVVLDLHNAAVEGATAGAGRITWLYRLVISQADAVIVTNNALVRRLGTLPRRCLVLPDPLPQLVCPEIEDGPRSNLVFVVSTWAEDEPLQAIIDCAEHLSGELRLAISGRPRGSMVAHAAANSKITLLGYLSDTDYVAMLCRAAVVVDLTTRADCLVCGAYEALSVGQALVVSDTPALRDLLGSGATYCVNEPIAIAEAINKIAADLESARAKSAARAVGYHREWELSRESVVRAVAGLSALR